MQICTQKVRLNEFLLNRVFMHTNKTLNKEIIIGFLTFKLEDSIKLIEY